MRLFLANAASVVICTGAISACASHGARKPHPTRLIEAAQPRTIEVQKQAVIENRVEVKRHCNIPAKPIGNPADSMLVRVQRLSNYNDKLEQSLKDCNK